MTSEYQLPCDGCGLRHPDQDLRHLRDRWLCPACYYVQGAAEVAELLRGTTLGVDDLRYLGHVQAEMAQIEEAIHLELAARWRYREREQDEIARRARG